MTIFRHRELKSTFLLFFSLTPSIMAPPSAIDIEGVTDTQAVVVLPDPLTVNGVPARRAKAGNLVAGTAAYTSSDFFKGSVSISSSFRVLVLIIEDFWEAKSQKMGP